MGRGRAISRRLAALMTAGLIAGCGAQTTAGDSTASESSGADRRPRGYLRADANGDGVVTRAEIVAEAEARFRSIDTDGDSTVSSAKLSGRRKRALGSEEDVKDMRPARPVTLAQFRARALARFDRRDADGDGRIKGDELTRRIRRRAAP